MVDLLDEQGWGFISKEAKNSLTDLEAQRSKILKEREETWRLRSKAIWLKVGDDNTNFFHNCAKGRRASNTIWKIPTDHGQFTHNFHQLAHLGNNHFQQLFRAPPGASLAEIICIARLFPCFVDLDASEDLTEHVPMGELEITLKWFKKDKIPGPDGWTIKFYLAFFEIIRLGLLDLKVVEECTTSGRMYEAMNSTFIALIPKVDSPQSFNDF